MRRLLLLVLVFSWAGSAQAAQKHHNQMHHGHHSAYAGQETREIKSLSSADIDTLERGGGWGLAKAAELNGVPGPLHLLELKDEIPLSPDQVKAIEREFDTMQAQAKAQGRILISLERDLDSMFKEGDVAPVDLRRRLKAIGEARAELRFIHLAAHLRTPGILSADQIARYNALRGYTAAGDPCAKAPDGHDPAMWRKHQGCD